MKYNKTRKYIDNLLMDSAKFDGKYIKIRISTFCSIRQDLLAQKEDKKECHCGKNGHALNSINCPVHGYTTILNKKTIKEITTPSPIEQPDNIIIKSTDSIGYEVDRALWDWIDDITRTVNFLRQSKK